MPPSGYRSLTIKESIYLKAQEIANKYGLSMPTFTERAMLYFIVNTKPELQEKLLSPDLVKAQAEITKT